MNTSVRIGIGAGLCIGGFYAGWEVSKRRFKKNMYKVVPLLAETVEGVISEAYRNNMDYEKFEIHMNKQLDMFEIAVKQMLYPNRSSQEIQRT